MGPIRRIGLGLGAALLVGGWGMMRYADEQQQTASVGKSRFTLWRDGIGESLSPSRHIYTAGVVLIALGAGTIGLSAPGPWRRDTSTPPPPPSPG